MQTTKIAATACIAVVVLLCLGIGPASAQENIQLQVPPSLVECYNTSYFMNRDNRLPSNIETLISIIEKVENSNGFNGDIRTLSASLLHRFRQDGIQRAPGVNAMSGVLPYSPTGFQFPKFRILLSRLIPTSTAFPNDTLTQVERCSLHFMLSSSFETQVRGDEGQVCSQLAQYRSQRLARAVPPQARNNNFVGDVEIMDSLKQRRSQMRGMPRARYTQWDGMSENQYDQDFGFISQTDLNQISQCPVENGGMWTPWGTVAAGNLLAGIAAGLQPQMVALRTLLALASRGGPSSPQTATVRVDNRFAATLAGDLAEVALVQVPVTTSERATVGANGAWNSTVLPRWYFLSQRQNLEMTDAEIRGGLDGLIIAMNITQWRTQASSLRLSQLLRMYYSMGGVLNSGVRACNRRELFPDVASTTNLIAQTSAFAQVLDREMQLVVTLTPEAIANFSTEAANALTAYIPSSLNDVSCLVSSAQDISESITPITNIYVFLDTTWQYATIVEYVVYILQRLNINAFASTVTILAASDGSVMVNTTDYLPAVYQAWNATTHSMYTPGFNLPVVLRTVQNLTQSYMNVQQANSSVGGASTIALLVPLASTISGTDSSFATTQLQFIYEQVPDLHFIYYTGGPTNSFQSFVRDPHNDLFALNTGSTAAVSSGPVVMRLRKTLVSEPCLDAWTLARPEDITNTTTIMTNIFVFIDTFWPYNHIVEYISYVIQRLNVNARASSVTLLAASNGRAIVNSTQHLSEFYESWNTTTHSSHTAGFSMPVVLSTARDLAEQVMNAERNSSSLGGQSLIALVVPSPVAFISDIDYAYAIRFIDHLNASIPDLHFIYYAGGAVIRFNDFVNNPREDLFPLNFNTPVRDASHPVVERIRRVPRRLANPRCGADWSSPVAGPDQMTQHARLGTINFYRLAPQYFYPRRSMRYLKVQAISGITFTVCTSRTAALPHRVGSATPDGQSCHQVTPTTHFSHDLTDACDGYDTIAACPPLFVSVQAQGFADLTQVACEAPDCQTPDQAQYLLFVHNLSCRNAATRENANLGWLIATVALAKVICVFN